MFPIRVGLNRVLGALMMGVGAFNLYVYLLSSRTTQVVLAGVFGLVGLLYLIGDLLVVTATEVQIKNPLGMTLKSHPIGSLADLEVREKKLYVGEKKIASLGFAATGGDVQRLVRAIEGARAGKADAGRPPA
jgi:hypothetical protein